MATFCNVQLRVISGHELPKTDLFSQIDPYVVVSLHGEVVGRTCSRDNNANPVWQEDFFLEVEEHDSLLQGIVSLELYDEEVTKDEHVGTAILELQSLAPEHLLEPLELPLHFKHDKRGQKLAKSARRARIAVQVVSIGKAFSSYAVDLAGSDEALVDEASGTFLLPVPDTEDAVWVGMHFSPRSTHLLLVSTLDPKAAPNPVLSYDLSYPNVPSMRVERLLYRKPVKLMGLKVWSELRATNVPLDAKLGKVRIQEREHRLVDTLEPAELLVANNYMIGMPFLAAVKELSKRSAHVDTTAQCIWIKMDSNQPQPAQLLQLDYGRGAAASTAPAAPGAAKDDKFPVLRICSTSSELNKGYQLMFFGGGGRGAAGPMVTVSEAFRRPVPVLGGMYDVVHTIELRDAFRGDTLEEAGLGCYEMVRPSRTWRFGKLLDWATQGELGEIDEAGANGGGADVEGGVDAESGAMRRVRDMFSWLPCLKPPRAEEYLEEGGEAERRESRGGRSRGTQREEDGGEVRSRGRNAAASFKSPRSAGSEAPDRLPYAGGRGGAGAGPGSSKVAASGGRSAASVGSSSGRSANLATYHNRGRLASVGSRKGSAKMRRSSDAEDD